MAAVARIPPDDGSPGVDGEFAGSEERRSHTDVELSLVGRTGRLDGVTAREGDGADCGETGEITPAVHTRVSVREGFRSCDSSEIMGIV